MNTSNSLIRSEDTVLTTVVGLDGVFVIATAAAVLARQHAERVRDLVEQLKSRNRTVALEQRRVYRPWGFYQSADSGSRHQGQTHLREPRSPALAAEALSPLRALGGAPRRRRGHDRRGGAALS